HAPQLVRAPTDIERHGDGLQPPARQQSRQQRGSVRGDNGNALTGSYDRGEYLREAAGHPVEIAPRQEATRRYERRMLRTPAEELTEKVIQDRFSHAGSIADPAEHHRPVEAAEARAEEG